MIEMPHACKKYASALAYCYSDFLGGDVVSALKCPSSFRGFSEYIGGYHLYEVLAECPA